MFRQPTVFIIGAGASFELGLPLGSTLANNIAKDLNFNAEGGRPTSGDHSFLQLLRNIGQLDGSHRSLIAAAAKLARGVTDFPSVDEAIHFFRNDADLVKVGKWQIASQLVAAEGTCRLKHDRSNGRVNTRSADDTWLKTFLTMALSETSLEDASKLFEHVTIINFNYDRTIEHYLYWALQERLSVSADAAASAVRTLKIIRPYGSIGPLNWQANGGISFGGYEGDVRDIRVLGDRIRTYTEQIHSDVRPAVQFGLANSASVVVLGFGFHKQNMELMRPDDVQAAGARQVFATMIGYSNENLTLFKHDLEQIMRSRSARLFQLSAKDLLQELYPVLMNNFR